MQNFTKEILNEAVKLNEQFPNLPFETISKIARKNVQEKHGIKTEIQLTADVQKFMDDQIKEQELMRPLFPNERLKNFAKQSLGDEILVEDKKEEE